MPDWHRNDQSVVTVVIVAILVIAIAVLGVIGFRRYISDERQEESIRKAAEEYNSTMLEARRKKAELESELAILNEQGKIQVEGKGTLLFLCTEPDARVYTEVRPILEDAGFVGVIALTSDQFPGDANCLTLKEIHELQEEGWDTVLTVQRTADVRELMQRAKDAGLSPKGLYYANQQVDETSEELAKEMGLEVLFTYSSDQEATVEGIYRILTLGCNENGIKKVTEDSIASSQTMALSIGFRNSRELYDETSVTNMVAFVKKNTDAGDVQVAAVDGAVTGKKEVQRIMAEAQKKSEGRRRELETQIAELNDFILSGETAVAAASTAAEESSEELTEKASTEAAAVTTVQETPSARETIAMIISETESAEASTEGQTETESETETETETETEKKTEPKATEPKTTAAKKTEPATKAPETTAAKKKKTTSKPVETSPVIVETPGEVYVETPPETEPEESGPGWPDATIETVPFGPGVE